MALPSLYCTPTSRWSRIKQRTSKVSAFVVGIGGFVLGWGFAIFATLVGLAEIYHNPTNPEGWIYGLAFFVAWNIQH